MKKMDGSYTFEDLQYSSIIMLQIDPFSGVFSMAFSFDIAVEELHFFGTFHGPPFTFKKEANWPTKAACLPQVTEIKRKHKLYPP